MVGSNSADGEVDRRRGSVEKATGPRFLVIGQVTKPHGVRGEMRVTVLTELPERFSWLETVYVGEVNPYPVAVEAVRFHKDLVLLKLAGCDDRTAAEAMRGEWLQVPEAEAIPLQEGQYFLYQLEGLSVYSEEGALLGQLVDVLETRANNVFIVDGELGEILIPDIDEVVKTIDFDAGRMTVHLIPGLLDD